MKSEFDRLVEQLLSGNIFLEEAIEILEKGMIAGALERSGGKQTEASKRLGIHRNTLQRKMVQFGLGARRPRWRRKPAKSEGRVRKGKTGAA